MATSAVSRALVAYLGSDVTLLSAVPNGVYLSEAFPDATRFVIVRLILGFDEGVFGGRAYQDLHYEVEARGLDANAQIVQAADRLEQLLGADQPVSIAATGYVLTVTREEPIEEIEVDDINPDLRWYRRGGRYHVHAAPTG